MKSDQVVVVGGGIWGFSTAFHLAKCGLRNVTVVEQNAEAARETTPRAAGLVGQIRSSGVMCRAIGYALELLSDFENQTGIDPGLHRTGSLLVAMNDTRMEAYKQQVQRANGNGVTADFVDHAEMQRLAPSLNVSNLTGGYFVPGDGYLDPRQCALAYATAAQDLGVQVRYSTQVQELRIAHGKISGVDTTNGVIEADHVVVAAGPWTGVLGRLAGYNLPVQTIRHQRVVTAAIDDIPIHHPVVRVTDVSCYVRPEKGGYLYGFFEPAPTAIDLGDRPSDFRTDHLPDAVEIMDEARRRLSDVFPILGKIDVVERIQGITTFAPDGQYVLGPVPEVEGLHLASGCAALGIAGSAAVGKWIAETITTGKIPPDLATFSHARFGALAEDGTAVQEAALRFYGNYYSLTPGTPDP